jgi:hypothetical protein
MGTCSVLDIPFAAIDVAGRSDAEIDELSQTVGSEPFAIDGTPLVRFHAARADVHVVESAVALDGTNG